MLDEDKQCKKLIADLAAAAHLARKLGLTTAAYFAELARDEARASLWPET